MVSRCKFESRLDVPRYDVRGRGVVCPLVSRLRMPETGGSGRIWLVLTYGPGAASWNGGLDGTGQLESISVSQRLTLPG